MHAVLLLRNATIVGAAAWIFFGIWDLVARWNFDEGRDIFARGAWFVFVGALVALAAFALAEIVEYTRRRD